MASAPEAEWVSKSYSSAARRRSPSWPFGKISTSQSIAHLSSLSQQLVDLGDIIARKRLAKHVQAVFEALQRGEHGGPILLEDRRPDFGIAAGDARRVSKAGRGQVAQGV